jgi:hypothetical protein
MHGAQGRNRTTDTVIFSHVLYQLSYLGAVRLGGRTRSAGYKCSVGRCPERAPRSPAPRAGKRRRRWIAGRLAAAE